MAFRSNPIELHIHSLRQTMSFYYESKQYELIKNIMIEHINSNIDMQTRWFDIDNNFREWEKSICGKFSSLLNHQTYLVSNIYKEFPELYDKSRNMINDIVIGDVFRIGQHIVIKDVDYKIIDRNITIRGGVTLTLQSKDLKILVHEFFD